MDPFSLGTLYEKISKGEIAGIPPDIKPSVLETLENFGIKLINDKRYWKSINPVDLIDEINKTILQIITQRKNQKRELSEAEVDVHRKLRIVFYHIRHVVRGMLHRGV